MSWESLFRQNTIGKSAMNQSHTHTHIHRLHTLLGVFIGFLVVFEEMLLVGGLVDPELCCVAIEWTVVIGFYVESTIS